MRPPVDAARIHEFAHRLGRVAPNRVRVYLTGGATAVLEGWRTSTIDSDLQPDERPPGPVTSVGGGAAASRDAPGRSPQVPTPGPLKETQFRLPIWVAGPPVACRNVR